MSSQIIPLKVRQIFGEYRPNHRDYSLAALTTTYRLSSRDYTGAASTLSTDVGLNVGAQLILGARPRSSS